MASIDNKRLRKKKVRKVNKSTSSVIENQKNQNQNETQRQTLTTASEHNHVDAVTSSQPQAKVSGLSSIRSMSPDDPQINEEETGFLLHEDYPAHPSPEPDPLASNPYLNREKCLLCQRDRNEDDESDSEDEDLKIGPHNYALSQMSLWVCPKCKATLEEEERKGIPEPSFLNEEIEPDPNTLKFLSELQFNSGGGVEEVDLKSCECEACKDRRQIEKEQEEENSKLQQCWADLLHAIRCIYRDNEKCLTDKGGMIDKAMCKRHVAKLCGRDSHQLYQRLESHSIDYILEVKVKLLQQLTRGHDTPELAKAFVSLMLREYDSLCSSAKILAAIFKQLESEHLKRFNLNWELHDKHIFRSIVFGDAVLRSALPMLITQLRLGAASKEAYVEDSYPSVLHRYLSFDDEMSVVGSVYIDCQIRLDQYSDQQAAMQAKQKMLREDWEFFSAQRKILKDTMMKNQSSTQQTSAATESETPIYPIVTTSSSCMEYKTTTSTMTNGDTTKCLESQLAEAMRNLLDYPTNTKFTCPNCKKRKCPCQHCAVTHLIACGVLAPELQDILLPLPTTNGCCISSSANPFTIPSPSIGFDISVKAPSFSSTDSSSDVDSDGPASGYASTDSWDEKLKLNPDLNLFEEFLKDASREKTLLKKGDRNSADLDAVAPNDLSEPSPCQCPECKKPSLCINNSNSILGSTSNVSSNVTSGQSSTFPTVPVTSIPKPAALHLYPHIHGSRRLSGGSSATAGQYGAARLAATGSLSAAHYEAVIQPHLYNLQNSNPLTSQSHLAKHLDKLKQQQKQAGLSAFSTPSFTSAPLQPCLKDQLKSKHTCASTEHSRSLYNHLSGIGTAPPFSSMSPYANYANYKFPDISSYTSTTRINTSDLLTAPPPPFNPNAFPLDSMLTANVPHVTSNATRATKLHSWQMMAQQVQPSCLIAYPDANHSDTPHEHTDECFKHLRGPLNHTSTASTTSTATDTATAKNLDLYNKLSGCFSPVTSSAAVSVAASSDKQHRPTTSNKPTHSMTSCATNTVKHEPTNSLPTTKTKTSNAPTTCQHQALNKNKTSTSTATAKSQDVGKMNKKGDRRNNLHHHHHPAGSTTSQSSGETGGGGGGGGENSPLNSDDDDSGQSSSTSVSTTKDSNKYCDCCYCEFFGHAQPTTAPISKNFLEMRDRLRLRLKKKKQNHPCSNGHDLVPISQLTALAASSPGLQSSPPYAEIKQKAATSVSSGNYPDVEKLVEFITGEPVNISEPIKLDKKQKRKMKKAEQRAKKLEQMQQLPRADSKSSLANSDSEGDSDSDKILAQLETKSSASHQQQSSKQPHPKESLVALSVTQPQGQSKKGKKENSSKAESLRRHQSLSPDKDEAKLHASKMSPQSIDRQQQQSTKLPQKSTPSKDSKLSKSPLPEQLNNAKSLARQSSPLDKQHHRTHSNQLGQPADCESSSSSKTHHQATKAVSRSAEKKKENLTDRRIGEAASDAPHHSSTAERPAATLSVHETKKLPPMKNKENVQLPPTNKEQQRPAAANQKQHQSESSNQKQQQPVPSNQRQQPEGQEDLTESTKTPATSITSSSSDQTTVRDETKKSPKGATSVDDIFMPKDDDEFENDDEKEINAFKRFVMTKPPTREKMAVNVNLKILQPAKRKL